MPRSNASFSSQPSFPTGTMDSSAYAPLDPMPPSPHRSFLGLTLRRFWRSQGAARSGTGVIVVALAVVATLMASDIIGIAVALSMTASLTGGWVSSASGVSLARDGWRGAVFNSVCSLTIFFLLYQTVHLLAPANAASFPAPTPAPVAVAVKTEPINAALYVASLPAAARHAATNFSMALDEAATPRTTRDHKTLQPLVNRLTQSRLCLSEVFAMPIHFAEVSTDLERLTLVTPVRIAAYKEVQRTASTRKPSTKNCG